MVRSFGMNPKVGGSIPSQVRTLSVSKPWHFHKNIRSCLQKYLYSQSQCSKTWDSKCLALIARMVGAFGMNPKVGCSCPSQVEAFSVSKILTLSQEHPFVCENECCAFDILTYLRLVLRICPMKNWPYCAYMRNKSPYSSLYPGRHQENCVRRTWVK